MKTTQTTKTAATNKKEKTMEKRTRLEFVHVSEILGRVTEHVTHLPSKSWVEYDAKKITGHIHFRLHDKGALIVMFDGDDATFAFWLRAEERKRVDNANASIQLYGDALNGDVLRIVSREKRLLYLFRDALDITRVQYRVENA